MQRIIMYDVYRKDAVYSMCSFDFIIARWHVYDGVEVVLL